MQAEHSLTFVELVRVGWPIFLGLLGLVFWQGKESTMNSNTREEFKAFKGKEYVDDKNSILAAIKELKDSQEKSEIRVEAKLDKMVEEVQKANLTLAELRGKLSNTGSMVTDLKT